jgi:hypothetical protein
VGMAVILPGARSGETESRPRSNPWPAEPGQGRRLRAPRRCRGAWPSLRASAWALSTSGNMCRAAAEAMASARGRCSSTRASRARRAGTCCRRREGEESEATCGDGGDPQPPAAGRSATARTPHEALPLGRMARSLTRREDWPRDALGVGRPGGEPAPPRLRSRATRSGRRPASLMG